MVAMEFPMMTIAPCHIDTSHAWLLWHCCTIITCLVVLVAKGFGIGPCAVWCMVRFTVNLIASAMLSVVQRVHV
jgi:hypothetical protein